MKYANGPKGALASALPRIIYVEGQDDAWFIDAILGELGADPEQVGIVYIEGNGKVAQEIGFLLKSSGYIQRRTTNIALLLDADASAWQTLATLHATLGKMGLPSPGSGEIASYDGDRRLGVYIFPDGASNGAIEELLLGTVAGDNRLETVDRALTTIEGAHGELDHRTKRLVRMYISTLPIKPCGIGRAYCEGVFARNNPGLDALRVFMRDFLS